MKWSVVVLLVLGVVAAICAALLVMALTPARGQSVMHVGNNGQEAMATILVASRELPPLSVIDDTCVTSVSIPQSKQVPESFTAAVEITGKVLAGSLVKGQPFTRNCFASDGPRFRLAGTVPNGKRAMGILVTDHGGLDGVLYPGCIVDVLATFKSSTGEGISKTLVSGVEVLAIEQQTIILDNESKRQDATGTALSEAANNVRASSNNARRVTLLVDLKQAKSLQLAMEQGTISLVLRNPRDVARVGMDVVRSSSIQQEFAADLPIETKAPATQPSKPAQPTQPVVAPPAPQWETIIIRGNAIERRQFEIPGPDSRSLTRSR